MRLVGLHLMVAAGAFGLTLAVITLVELLS